MRWCKCLFVVSFVASVQFGGVARADTLDLMGGQATSYGLGWITGSNAWSVAAGGWCGDTINRDSGTVVACTDMDFITDTGGLIEGAYYLNWNYRLRSYYAQLPVVWNGWGGLDATGYNNLLIVYKGLLPIHKMTASFYYSYHDSIKNADKLGDGLGTLSASPNEWKTLVIPVPDSIDLAGITGLTLAIDNMPGKGGDTSAVGTIKIARIALFPSASAVANNKRGWAVPVGNQLVFTPAGGSVVLTMYSLSGKVVANRIVNVQAGTQYRVHQFARNNGGTLASQVRYATIRGEGVNATARIW